MANIEIQIQKPTVLETCSYFPVNFPAERTDANERPH